MSVAGDDCRRRQNTFGLIERLPMHIVKRKLDVSFEKVT